MAYAWATAPRVTSTRSVSPWKSGFGNVISPKPRFATVVPSVVSCTLMPITIAACLEVEHRVKEYMIAFLVPLAGGYFIKNFGQNALLTYFAVLMAIAVLCWVVVRVLEGPKSALELTGTRPPRA